MNLVFDFGNSTIKAAIFSGKRMKKAFLFQKITVRNVRRIMQEYSPDEVAIASVSGKEKLLADYLKKNNIPFTLLGPRTPVPIVNRYRSPRTLGMDRLAGVVAAHSLFGGNPVLLISVGTCITYDVVTAHGSYYGGNITAGIDMQLKALNTFTARLPLVKKGMSNQLSGSTTTTSIRNGVMRGTLLEMTGFIGGYAEKYKTLKVVLTGGDAGYFINPLRRLIANRESEIFAVPHAVLIGLNEILLHAHAEKD